MKNGMKMGSAILFLDKIMQRNGGPSTYLYNLRQGLRELNDKTIKIVSVNNTRDYKTDRVLFYFDRAFKRKENRLTYILFQIIYVINDIEYKFCTRGIVRRVCSEKIVHVHHVSDAVCLKLAGHYKGKIVLTMHTPEAWSDEVVHVMQQHFKTQRKFGIIWGYQHLIEIMACHFAEVFIFPSKEAEQIYLKYKFYNKVKGKKNVFYVITGVPFDKHKYDRAAIRKEFDIPQDVFVLLFIGRHTEIKGYDLLVSGNAAFAGNNIYVVCAGRENELYSTKHFKQWKELGWQTNVDKLYDIADAVILPNRETYFDLAAIEALSRGRILIASATGGNKTLAKETKGVILFKPGQINDMVSKVTEIKNMELLTKAELEQENKMFFEKNCTTKQFAKNYLNIVYKIFNESNL